MSKNKYYVNISYERHCKEINKFDEEIAYIIHITK